ncbi:MAG TPA: FHA domain-containing protein [Acidimicrobiales bacterium]|nr:FHA domain-containing protein [Acidimicrobiales bacterium]
MSDAVLTILKLVFLAGLYLFFFRVLRSVWAESSAPTTRETAVAQATAARVRVVAPPESKGQTFDLAEETTVGRGANCGIALGEDSTVSQLHARFFRQNNKLFVEDLGSTNGTFVNRRQAKRAVPVKRGDRVQIGQTVLELTR